MTFSITITADSLEQVKAQALAFIGSTVPAPAAAAAPKSSKAAKTTEATAPTPAATETPLPKIDASAVPVAAAGPATTPGADASTSTSSATAPNGPSIEEQVRALLTPMLRDADKSPKVTELMASFGATKLSKIPADKMAEVLEAAKALV